MKTTFLTLFATLTTLTALGQVVKSISLKGGVSIANQKAKYATFEDKSDNTTGLYGALNMEFFQNKFFSLSMDIGATQKGSQYKVERTDIDGNATEDSNVKTTITYLSISPQLKFHYDINKITPYVIVGPRLDQQLSCKSELDQAFVNEFNKTIIGLTYGAGLTINIGGGFDLLTEFQHQPDFTKVVDTKPSTGGGGVTTVNNAFVINAGLKYHFHK